MERLRSLRKKRGWTMKELGERLGVAESTISLYESGSRSPRPEVLHRMADLLEVTTDYLLGRGHDEQLARMLHRAGAIPIEQLPLLPVFGSIPAGSPAEAHAEVEEWIPAELPPGTDLSEYYYLRVNGDSMSGAGILSGSLVMMHTQRHADNGEIVACEIDGGDTTLKTFQREGNVVALIPQNPRYQPILLSAEEFDNGRAHILGVAVKVVTELKKGGLAVGRAPE